ncbi:ABC transporter permease [Isoptericola variabilis]|uniref:ABC-type transporter, integral membrane subunit n=1 Tax=Isoptericola variabilis (strain 225) TaxID=743718 RepID=F6FR41_ISOV2|nr:ABC transporter permease [Isoptericola variabilis]AEG44991.1 ABC-type transporter, integral membrane subunit [Isoptericola variabilis 225]TWH25997.1 peptide/nickel transport system permease protein [Isoptericola variabilis J7]
MSHLRFVGLRLASLLGLLWFLSLVLFVLQEVSGADPVAATIGGNAPPEAVAAARARLGLDDPAPQRYLVFLAGLASGDLGTSFRTRRPVTEDLMAYLPATVELVLVAFVIALLLGVVFAVSSMLRWPLSAVFRGLLFVGSTAPTFMLGIVGLIVFYKLLGWLPASGRGGVEDGPTGLTILDSLLAGDLPATGDALAHITLPALALAVGPALAVGRVLRSSLTDTLRSDHVRTATAKGLTEAQVLGRHVLRNSLNAALSMSALQLGFMFGGVLLIEGVFTWGGLGSYLGASLPVSDFPAIAGVTFVLGGLYVVVNTVADVLQSVADPRISVS